MKRTLALLLAGIMVFGLCGVTLAQDEPPPIPKVGDQAPDFTLPDAISGDDTNFNKDIKGKSKITVLSFMNTGCSACLAEVQEISNAIEEVGEDKVKAYCLAVDKRGEAVVRTYHETYGFKVNYLLDPDFSTPGMYGFSYTPALVIVGKDGKILYTKGGFNPSRDRGTIAAKIKELI